MLGLSENLARLRKEKGLTQDVVANFIGVSKAAVSKWETGQSYPDIMLLPQLASFFDISVDALLGYEPQLSKEQIQKQYADFAASFANEAYESVMARTNVLVKKYYACYPMLLQICVLWLNHLNLAPTPQRQQEVLQELAHLCEHIVVHAKQLEVQSDAVMFQAVVNLQLGKIPEVIDVLEPFLDPKRLGHQSGGVLIQAYQLSGESDKAHRFTQMSMYNHLLALIGSATSYLQLHPTDVLRTQPTIERVDGLLALYDVGELHPNSVAIYQYQVALTYLAQADDSQALARLVKFVEAIEILLNSEIILHGDDYFDTLDDWFADLALGNSAVRDQRLILASSIQMLQHPQFSSLETEPMYQLLVTKLTKRGTQL